MKIATTSERLKEIMDREGLRQIDILNAAKPFCEKYNVKLGKNDLSQYVNGKFEPKQKKLTVLGLALNVNEAWLMGYDVNPSREQNMEEISTEKRFAIEQDPSEIMFALSRGGEQTVTDEMFEEVKQSAAFIAQREANKK